MLLIGTVTKLVWRPAGFDWHLISILSLLCFSLLGLEIASNVGDEIQDPRRTLPRALLTGACTLAVSGIAGTCMTLIATASAFVPTRQVEHLGLFELKVFGFCGIVLGSGAVCFRGIPSGGIAILSRGDAMFRRAILTRGPR